MPTYTVKSGDNLSHIASRNGINITDMTITTTAGTFDLSKPNYDGFSIHQIDIGNTVSWECQPLSPNAGNDANANANKPHKECVGHLNVKLVYANDQNAPSPYLQNTRVLVGGSVEVTIQGIDANNQSVTDTKTTSTGIVEFRDLQPGNYQIAATYTQEFALVQTALQYQASHNTRWQYNSAITSFDGDISIPGDTNKCNFFVYDMIERTYGTAPVYTYQRRLSAIFGHKTVPALAGHWATFDNSSSDETEGWRNIAFTQERTPVEPGSILAISRANAQGATGHVSIIAYPEDGQVEKLVAGGGMSDSVYLTMQGQTISAAGTAIVHNNWGFRTSNSPETSSINSPNAGIEIRE